MSDFHKGDTVEVKLTGVVESRVQGGWLDVQVSGVGLVSVPCSGGGVSVEVLARADDPASRANRYRVGRKNSRNIYRVDGDGYESDTHIGVVFDPDDGPRVVAALNALPEADPEEYPEVSGGGVPYPPVHVDNEAIVEGRYGKKWSEMVGQVDVAETIEDAARTREPRVFRSDGPEPPEDVTALHDGSDSIPFLVRRGDHWRWAKNLDVPEAPSYTGGSWSYVTGEMERPVAFTEVLS